jgi:hypothetical protein
MCPDFIVGTIAESDANVLRPDYDVTETLAPDQSDQPFGNATLPKRELVR